MGRELRKVPANWEHPKKDNGSYQPMHNEFYGDVLHEWIKENEEWENGSHPDLIAHPEYKEECPFWAMYNGDCPDYKYYQTREYKPEELTHIQLYETTTEGTPCSPLFKAEELEKLCEWAAENATTFASFKATKEQWFKMLSNNFISHTEGNVTFF